MSHGRTPPRNQLLNDCQALKHLSGVGAFHQQGSSPEELVKACLGPTATGEVSGAKFHAALQEIYVQNGLVDRDFVNR